MGTLVFIIVMDEILVAQALPKEGGGIDGCEFTVKKAAHRFLLGLYEKHVILLDRFRDLYRVVSDFRKW
jgi:hypothetical protein